MKKYSFILVAIAAAACMRLVPHPANITPICAIGLFGAAYLDRRWLAILTPFVALFLSDLVLNNIVYKQYFTSFQWITSPIMYVALAAVIGVGFLRLRQISVRNIITASVIGSIVFFLISNIWSWQWDPMYAKDMAGLLTCYTAGLPFLARSIVGDLMYCGVLFGAVALAMRSTKLAFQRA
jgi:uncharacterized membrane protein SirB2